MFETKLQTNNFKYKKIKIENIYLDIKTEPLYTIKCKFLLFNDIFYTFLLIHHAQIIFLTYIQDEKIFFAINIDNISQLIKYIDITSSKITKLNTLFKDNLNTNELFENNIFKITNNYDFIINTKFHDNLLNFNIEKEDVINELFNLEQIMDLKASK